MSNQPAYLYWLIVGCEAAFWLQYDLALWLRCIVAWVIAVALLIALIGYVDNEAITKELHLWFRIAFGSVFFWFVFGPVWSLLSFVARYRNDA